MTNQNSIGASYSTLGLFITCLVLLLGQQSARAQDVPVPQSVEQTGRPVPPPLLSGLHLAAITGVSEIPAVFAGLSWNALQLAVGVAASNEVPPGGTGPNSVYAGLITSVQYAVYNRAPVALGPEISWSTNLTGEAFRSNTLLPGFGFWFAPFNAPILLGCAWNVRLSFAQGKDATFAFMTPALRLAFGLF